jgi:co-chaperonin GroES (HSP10)
MLNPVNRYISINLQPANSSPESLIVLPDDYQPDPESYVEVEAIKAAEDVRFEVSGGTKLIVDRSMIEEISIGGTIYNVILDNYVVGIVE